MASPRLCSLRFSASGIKGIPGPGKINSTSTNLAFPSITSSRSRACLLLLFSGSVRLFTIPSWHTCDLCPSCAASDDRRGGVRNCFTSPLKPRFRLLSSRQILCTPRFLVPSKADRGFEAWLWCYGPASNIAVLLRGLDIATRSWFRVD